MLMRTKRISALMLVGLLILAVAVIPGFAAPKQVKIVVTTWDGGEGLALQQQMAEAFMKKNPDIKVELQSIVQGYDEKLQTMNASGNTPDALLLWNTPQYVESGIIADLSSFVKKEKYDMKQFFDVTAQWATYKGKVYGLPKDCTPRGIWYNKKSFDDAGIAYPKEGWTWDQFTDTVKKLSNGKTGPEAKYGYIALAGHTYQLQGYIWSNGGDLCNLKGTKASGFINSPATVETIKWYKKVFDLSAQALVASKEANPGNAEFLSGRVAMMDNGTWPLADLPKDGSVKYGIVSPPVPKAGQKFMPTIHSAVWSVFQKSKNQAAAWEFVKYAASAEGQKIVCSTGFAIPTQKTLAAQIKPDDKLYPFIQLLNMPTKMPVFGRTPKWFEADSEFQKACEKVFLNNEDAQKSLTEAAKAMDKILQSK